MNWLERMNDAIDYIEDHLTENIDYTAVAKRTYCSVYNFQRIFSFIISVPVAEYIRNRRLTLAAQELQNTSKRMIDLAVKYQYESQE
ncbi:MAG: AraC family transcriptional regulator, partial [Gorillibacterium sp.]|nr:AraC family transcriptional regulator [Gorillibacterium sp.]